MSDVLDFFRHDDRIYAILLQRGEYAPILRFVKAAQQLTCQ